MNKFKFVVFRWCACLKEYVDVLNVYEYFPIDCKKDGKVCNSITITIVHFRVNGNIVHESF